MPDTSIIDECLELFPNVALRPESFGALAYNFGNRRLTFLKRPELAAVVRGLNGTQPAREVLIAAGVPLSQWTTYARVLESLVEAEMIRRPEHEVTCG